VPTYLNDRQRVPAIAVISMLMVSFVVVALTATLLYRHNFNEHVRDLEIMVTGQARLIEATAKFDNAAGDDGRAGEAGAGTLAQIRALYSTEKGFGETGEFLIAGRGADAIDYLTAFRFPYADSAQSGLSVPDGDEAMNRALAGETGWTVTSDYRNEQVVAAFAPIPALRLGIVAKLDVREIREPFLRAAAWAMVAALLVIVLGAVVVRRLTHQIVDRVHESEKQLRLAGEASGVGLWDIDIPTGHTHFDAQFYAMLGYGPDELESSLETWLALLHPDYRDYAADYYADHIANARIDQPTLYEMEFPMQCKDGTYKWILDRARIMEWQEGKPVRIIGTHIDITDQKRAEENFEAANRSAAESEERLGLAVEAAGMGFWDWNLANPKLLISDQSLALLGYGPGSLPSTLEAWQALRHPDDLAESKNAIDRYVERARADHDLFYEQSYRMRHIDGGYRWILDRGKVVEWDDGEPVRWLGIHSDITESKEAESEVKAALLAAEEANESKQESEERLSLAVASANMGMWDLDATTGEIVLNAQYMAMLGYEQFELPHNMETWKSLVHRLDIDAAETYFSTYLERASADKNAVYHQEYRMRKKDGAYRWIEDRGEVVEWENDEPQRFVGTHMDITERKESEERVRLAIESAGSGFFDRNMRTGELLLSEQSMAMLGYTHHELPHTYETWAKLRHPDDIEHALEIMDRFIENAREDHRLMYEQAYRMQHKDGDYRWILIRGRILEWDGDEPLRWLGTHTDVTEYKEAEAATVAAEAAAKAADAARLASEHRLRIAVESSNMGFWDLDMRTGQLTLEGSSLAQFGYPEDELPRNLDDWIGLQHPDDSERANSHRDACIEALTRGEDIIYEQEYRMRCKDGSYRWIIDRGRIDEWDNGQPVRAFGTHIDINTRKESEDALHRSQQLLEGVVDNAGTLVFVKDRNGVYLLANHLWEEYCGVTVEDALGKTDKDIFPPELAAEFMANDIKVRESGEHLKFEEDTYPKGEHRVLLSHKFPLYGANGEIFATAGISSDVTHLKEIEIELRNAREAAENASRSKSDFLANMSHEIRTPMNGIMGMTELAMDTDLNREQREYLQTIESSAQSLLALIDDILDFSKIEAQKLELDPIDFDLRERLGETLDTLAARAHGKGLELAFDIDADVPDMLIGDVHRVRQIVINLVGNALKFTEQGEVVVRVGVESESDSGILTHFQVSDTGIGIPADRLDKVFDSFEQADTSTTRKYGGTGLGLTICSRLTELMGGRIWVESTAGIGSTFHFTALLGRSQKQRTRINPKAVGELQGLKVLVVDDNQTNRQILEKMLTNWHMTPTLAHDATHGLEAFGEAFDAGAPFDVIISDVHMPGMDGYEFVQSIKDNDAWRNAPVIILTSARRSEDAERCRELGIKANLLKPAKQSRILDAVITAVGVETVSAKHEPADGAQASGQPETASLRILIAEDNEVNQKFAVRALKKAGHTSTIANNGLEAVEAFEREDYDVILMDVQMPEMDGYEATAAIRERESATGTTIPIIALTAHAMKGDREKCFAAGMNGYVTKPVKSKALLAEIARLVEADESVA